MVGYGLRMMLRRESPFGIRPRMSRDLVDWGFRFWRAARPDHVERSAPLLRDLNLASRAAYVELAEAWGNPFGLVERGLLMLCKTEDALAEERALAARARDLGLAADVLTPEEAAKLDPDVRMVVAGAVHFAQDCHLHPGRLLAALTERLTNAGVEIRHGVEVRGLTRKDARIAAARTDRGDVPGEEFVLAGGAWSPELLRPLGIRLPMQAGKGYSMTVEHPQELPGLCSILTEARVAVTPMAGALRFAGTMEVTGNDLSVNAARVRGIARSVPRYFPAFTQEDFRAAPVWSGLRPCSPDGLPYVGRFRAVENVIAATGHAMMGVSLAPVTGRLVAELLSDERPSISLDLLVPDRFQ
jgi:D-amino-acid dehydrogenase